MKTWKRVASMLMALAMTTSFAACGGMGGGDSTGGGSTGGGQSTGGGDSTGGNGGDIIGGGVGDIIGGGVGDIVGGITGGIEDIVNGQISEMAQKYKSAISATAAETKAVKFDVEIELEKNPFEGTTGTIGFDIILSESEQGMALSIYGWDAYVEDGEQENEYVRVIMKDGYIYTKNWDNDTNDDGTVDSEQNATWYRGEMPYELAMIMSGELQAMIQQMLGGGAEMANDEMGGDVIEGEGSFDEEMGSAESGANSMMQLISMAIQTKEMQAAFEFLGKAFEYGYGAIVDAGTVTENTWSITTDFNPAYDFVYGWWDGINPETMTFAQYEEYILKTMGIEVSFEQLMSEMATLVSKPLPYALDILNSFTTENFDMTLQEFKDAAVDAVAESEIGELFFMAMGYDETMMAEQLAQIKAFQFDSIFTDMIPEYAEMTFKDFINMMVASSESGGDINQGGSYDEYPDEGKTEEKVETVSAAMGEDMGEAEVEMTDYVAEFFAMMNQMKDVTLAEMDFVKGEIPVTAVREAQVTNTITFSEDETKVVGAKTEIGFDVDIKAQDWDYETQDYVTITGALAMSAEISVVEFMTTAQAIVAPENFQEVQQGGNGGSSMNVRIIEDGVVYMEVCEEFIEGKYQVNDEYIFAFSAHGVGYPYGNLIYLESVKFVAESEAEQEIMNQFREFVAMKGGEYFVTISEDGSYRFVICYYVYEDGKEIVAEYPIPTIAEMMEMMEMMNEEK